MSEGSVVASRHPTIFRDPVEFLEALNQVRGRPSFPLGPEGRKFQRVDGLLGARTPLVQAVALNLSISH